MDDFDYCVWGNGFSSEQIQNLNKIIEEKYFQTENPESGTDFKNVSSVKLFYYRDVKNIIGDFIERAYLDASTHFGYNVFPTNDFDVLNHGTYDSKDKSDYNWHRDTSRTSIYDIKLTLLINVSDEPYEGGEFELLTGKNPERVEHYNTSGNVIMFKSHILHRVLPVTSGIRKSLALFIRGPRFQ